MNYQLPLPFMHTSKAPESIVGDLMRFDMFGKKTEVIEEGGIRYFVNEFWTSRQRQANRIHEISYRACFKPQLPEFFISRATKEGDRVYDPFMGRGTTPVQAALMRRTPVGNDLNPLSIMLTRPRLNCPSLDQIKARLETIPISHRPFEDGDLLVFYHPKTLSEIYSLRKWLFDREMSRDFDDVDDWIRMVAINRLTGHSSGFFSVYTLPPNQAVSPESQKKINEKRNQAPVYRDVRAIIYKKSRSLLSQGRLRSLYAPLLLTSSADNTPQIRQNSISLIVTSPPFLDIVQYKSDNWLRCWFAGIDPDAVSLSIHRDVDSWTAFVRGCLTEFHRILKVGGLVAFEVGEVRNGKVLLEKYVQRASEKLPFRFIGVMVNDQKFTKTSNCWGIRNNAHGTNTNRIVLLEKLA